MSARGAAGDRDEIGVATIVGDVLAHPGDRSLHVDEVSRKCAARALAVVDRDADPAELHHAAHQGVGLRTLPVEGPRAAGDLYQHRRMTAGRQVMTTPDVEQVLRTTRTIGDVG